MNRSILVYTHEGKTYVVVIGGASEFKTKRQVLTAGTEEVFEVSRPVNEPFLNLLRDFIAEADKREITDIQFLEDLLFRKVQLGVAIPRTGSGTVH
jgi:hypothetical protein